MAKNKPGKPEMLKPKPVKVNDPTKALGNIKAIYPIKVDQTISQVTSGR